MLNRRRSPFETGVCRFAAVALTFAWALCGPAGRVQAADWTEGFSSLTDWAVQSGAMMTLSTAENNGIYPGANSAAPALAGSEMFRSTGSRPYHTGKVTGYFYDGKMRRASQCGYSYGQMLQLADASGSAFQWGVGFYQTGAVSDYFVRDSGAAFTSIGERGIPNNCATARWLTFVVEFRADGTAYRAVTDPFLTRSAVSARSQDVINAGIGRVLAGLNSLSNDQGYWDDIVWDGYDCGAPSGIAATATSSSAITWTANAAADGNQFGFALMDGAVEKALSPLNVRQASASVTETGLTANTAYTRAIRAWNGDNNSASSATLTRYTLANAGVWDGANGNVRCDNASVNIWYGPGTTFTFSNPAGFGTNGVWKASSFEYKFTESPTDSWASPGAPWQAGTISITPPSAGFWYLHVRPVNGDGVPNNGSVVAMGPFRYDPADPAPAWTFDTGAASLAPPGVYNRYNGSGWDDAKVFASSNSVAYGIRGTGVGAGQQLWTPLALGGAVQARLPVASLVVGSPAASTPAVIIGSQDGNVYARRVSDGSGIWTHFLGAGYKCTAKPGGAIGRTVGGYTGDVIFAVTDAIGQDNFLRLVRATDGSELWTFQPSGASRMGPILGSPLLVTAGTGGTIYFGTTNDGLVSGKVYAVDLATGGVKPGWPIETGGPSSSIASSVGVGGSFLYAVNEAGELYRIALDGSSVTKITQLAPTGIYGAPFHVPPSNCLIISSNAGKVYRVNAATGGIDWAVDLDSPSVPIENRGSVYVGSGDHALYELSLATGAKTAHKIIPSVVGDPVVDVIYNRIYLGGGNGKIYAFGLPL